MSAKTHQLVGMGDRQISQHHTVQQRKNRRIRANGKGKDDKRHNEGTRRLAQQAQTKVQILNEILNPIYASRIAAFLLGLLDTTQVEARAAMRSFLREPLREVFLSFLLEVVAELVVQFLVRLRPAKQRPQPQRNRVQPMLRSHLQPPYRAA